MFETTIARPASRAGTALHCGRTARVTLLPAPAGAGVIFRRKDRAGALIAATPQAVADARLGVRLVNADGVSVMTVEHLLAAAALAAIDNLTVEIDGPELPIFDGSVAPFLNLIRQAGSATLEAPRRPIVIRETLKVESEGRFVTIEPHPSRRFEIAIDYADEAIGRQSLAFDLDRDERALARLARARTFCSAKDIATMRSAGLALGGSLDNAIVVDGRQILNSDGLKERDEFALHKAVDLIGDLALIGRPVIGFVRAEKPGHDLNTRLARKIAEAETDGAPISAGSAAV